MRDSVSQRPKPQESSKVNELFNVTRETNKSDPHLKLVSDPFVGGVNDTASGVESFFDETLLNHACGQTIGSTGPHLPRSE